jgi:hypothetical protein
VARFLDHPQIKGCGNLLGVSMIKLDIELIRKDCQDGLLPHQMASKYSVSKATIKRFLKNNNIKHIDTRSNLAWKENMLVSREATITGIKKAHVDGKFNNSYKQSSIRMCNAWANGTMSGIINSAKYKSAHIQAVNADEYKYVQAVNTKKIWQDEKYRTKILSILSIIRSTDEYKTKHLEAVRRAVRDPVMMENFRRATWDDPAYRQKQTDSHKNLYLDPIFREVSKVRAQKMWQSDEYRRNHAKARSGQAQTLTRPHLKVCSLLDSLGIKYTCEEPLGPWNFDIFIESANLLIEVQGDYWHGDSRPSQQSKDKAISTYIKEYFPHLKLNYIWEHECLTEGSVLAKLKYWLGLDKVEQVEYQFIDVGIALPDTKEADTFFYNWHYQHHGRHGLDIGGYVNGELAVLARFASVSRKEIATTLGHQPQEVLELARLVAHPKYQKKNLLSWFLARCEGIVKLEKPSVKCLVSFADSTYNHTGAVYKASNWTLARIVEPNYWYVDSAGWAMHKKTLWNHARSLKLSEPEYAAKNGFTKVWGKEKYKFTKVLI